MQQNLDMEYIHLYILYNNSQLIRYPRTGVAYRNVLDMGLLVTIKLLNQSGKVEVNIKLVHAFFFLFFNIYVYPMDCMFFYLRILNTTFPKYI